MNLISHFLNRYSRQSKICDTSLIEIHREFIKMEFINYWDIEKKMFWRYCFLDRNENRLEKFAKSLQNKDYQVGEIKITEDELFILYAEEYTVHSPSSLFEKCKNLSRLLKESRIEIFKGWNVSRNLN